MGDLRYTLTGVTITVNGIKHDEAKAIRAINEVVRDHSGRHLYTDGLAFPHVKELSEVLEKIQMPCL